MAERGRSLEQEIAEERRMRRTAVTAATRRPPEPSDPPDPPDPAGPESDGSDRPDDAAAQRMEHTSRWVDLQVRTAIERGEFDNLPGAGKPLHLGDTHDPDWWVKGLIERERITGVLPPALALRTEDTELDAALDREPTEDGGQRAVQEFNRRVIEARRQLQGGPPVVTPTRDEDAEVAAWRARRTERRERQRRTLDASDARPGDGSGLRWWRRRRRG